MYRTIIRLEPSVETAEMTVNGTTARQATHHCPAPPFQSITSSTNPQTAVTITA